MCPPTELSLALRPSYPAAPENHATGAPLGGKGAAAPNLPWTHTSEAWPPSSPPPSLQAEFQVSSLPLGIVGNAEIMPNIWMRTARCGRRFPSFQTLPLGWNAHVAPPPGRHSRGGLGASGCGGAACFSSAPPLALRWLPLGYLYVSSTRT